MSTQQIALTKVRRSRWQSREAFDEELLWELACSIRENGLINPIVVFPVDGAYELVAGEWLRRRGGSIRDRVQQ